MIKAYTLDRIIKKISLSNKKIKGLINANPYDKRTERRILKLEYQKEILKFYKKAKNTKSETKQREYLSIVKELKKASKIDLGRGKGRPKKGFFDSLLNSPDPLNRGFLRAFQMVGLLPTNLNPNSPEGQQILENLRESLGLVNITWDDFTNIVEKFYSNRIEEIFYRVDKLTRIGSGKLAKSDLLESANEILKDLENLNYESFDISKFDKAGIKGKKEVFKWVQRKMGKKAKKVDFKKVKWK